ncbi:hypothetical protein R1flu_026230 [Riccia fluitans]|uniref:BRISC and BRCA1-A complex member 2 n=1 Tax=Riccia fluitans TaxID=41844 RepID=A0ABD1XFD4_9MARC
MGTTTKGVPIMPALVPQLEYLRAYCPVPLRIDNIRKGHTNALYADRFTACIPCCLDHVRWDVVYNYQNPELPPDVVFGAEDQDFQPLLFVGDDNPAAQAAAHGAWTILRDWTAKDYSRLLRLLLELRSLYFRHQRKRVESIEDPRVRFEIGTISAMEGLEMRLITGGDRADEVQFAIPLDIDLSQVARRVGTSSSKLWSGISLQVSFTLQRGQTFTGEKAPQLRLHAPPAMREVFDVEDVKLPTWADRMCLMEYVPNVQDNLQAQVREAINAVGLRKTFVEALGPVFGRPLELETNLFRRVSVMVTSGLFCFLIHLNLPTQFPKQQPTLTFQSSQHFDARGRPITSRPYTEYPWSPRWEAGHMAQRVFEFVLDECDKFKKYCNDAVQQR